MSEQQPPVYVNVLAYNGARWLKACLESLLANGAAQQRILVIDNGSSDDSLAIARGFKAAEVLENGKNLGFAQGHNAGIRYALAHGAKYVALLNQDLQVKPGWLKSLLDFADSQPAIEALSPIVYDYEGKAIDTVFLRILRQNKGFEADYVAGRLKPFYEVPDTFGAAMFFNASVFRKVGGFDPNYFMYSEEADFFQRAEYHGVRVAVVTASGVCHWHVSSRPERKDIPRITYYSYRNRYMAMLKDPRSPLLSSLLRWPLRVVCDAAKEFRSWKGLFYAPVRVFVQLWLIAHLPAIIARRSREMRQACYL